ncbi:MAG: hypothetical protein ABIE03_06135 [Patescibacteria group bacterium]|nr:hypothetical protein [Patescibacteria group bacterium]
MNLKDFQKGNILIVSSAASVLIMTVLGALLVRLSSSVSYLPFLAYFIISLAFWILTIALSFKGTSRKLLFLPAFLISNVFGIWGLFISGAGKDLVGYCLLANVFIYTLLSLYVFEGKFTQISMFWSIPASVVLASYSGVNLVLILTFLGLLGLGINCIIKSTSKIWKVLPEKELVSIIADIKATNYIFAIAAISLSLVLLFLRSLDFI